MHTLKIGWGRRGIHIDAPVSLPGQMYMRISQKVRDPLYATALCVDDGQEAVIFCTCDIVILRLEEMDDPRISRILEPICALVHSMRPELPTDAILMGATHTHAGVGLADTPEATPDGQPIYSGAKYREFFIRQCAQAIVEAWDSRTEGAIAYGYGYAVVGHSRRVIYFDDTSLRADANPVAPNGHGIMYGNTNDPQFSHYEAGADHFLNALFTFDKNRSLTGMVINVPCPSQLSEHFTEQSSDFWHEVRQLVAEEYGENVYVLPQCAAAGDLSPRILHYKKAQQRRMALKYGLHYENPDNASDFNRVMGERADIAQRILESIRDIYSWARRDLQTDVPVYHKKETLPLPRRMITDEEKQWCEENIRRMDTELEAKMQGDPETVRKAVSAHNRIYHRNKRTIQRWQTQDADPNLPMECHVVRIGDIAFATNRFELYMDYMHRIQARSPFIQTFIIQLAGAEGGTYLPTERGAANKGYSASLFCNMVGPEGGQTYVEETLRMLNDLKNK